MELQTGIIIAISTFLGAMAGMMINAAVFGWWFRGWLSDMKDSLSKEIINSRHELRNEFSARLINIETDTRDTVIKLAEHRAEDKGMFQNHGMRIARLEGAASDA